MKVKDLYSRKILIDSLGVEDALIRLHEDNKDELNKHFMIMFQNIREDKKNGFKTVDWQLKFNLAGTTRNKQQLGNKTMNKKKVLQEVKDSWRETEELFEDHITPAKAADQLWQDFIRKTGKRTITGSVI